MKSNWHLLLVSALLAILNIGNCSVEKINSNVEESKDATANEVSKTTTEPPDPKNATDQPESIKQNETSSRISLVYSTTAKPKSAKATTTTTTEGPDDRHDHEFDDAELLDDQDGESRAFFDFLGDVAKGIGTVVGGIGHVVLSPITAIVNAVKGSPQPQANNVINSTTTQLPRQPTVQYPVLQKPVSPQFPPAPNPSIPERYPTSNYGNYAPLPRYNPYQIASRYQQPPAYPHISRYPQYPWPPKPYPPGEDTYFLRYPWITQPSLRFSRPPRPTMYDQYPMYQPLNPYMPRYPFHPPQMQVYAYPKGLSVFSGRSPSYLTVDTKSTKALEPESSFDELPALDDSGKTKTATSSPRSGSRASIPIEDSSPSTSSPQVSDHPPIESHLVQKNISSSSSSRSEKSSTIVEEIEETEEEIPSRVDIGEKTRGSRTSFVDEGEGSADKDKKDENKKVETKVDTFK